MKYTDSDKSVWSLCVANNTTKNPLIKGLMHDQVVEP